MSKFPWGKVIERFIYNFDGEELEIVKYHPWESNRGIIDYEKVMYDCEEIGQSACNLHYILIAYIVHKRIGANEHSLIKGIARALCCEHSRELTRTDI